MPRKHYCPVFVYKENEFFVAIPAFHGRTIDEAAAIAEKAKGGECQRFGFRYTDRIISFDRPIQHVKANIHGFPINCIAGPIFEKAVSNERKKIIRLDS